MSQPESTANSDDTRDAGDQPARVAPAARTVSTDDLFGGARELRIQHGDQQYRLRITAAGKLILTK